MTWPGNLDVSTDQSVPSPFDEPDEEVDVSTIQLGPSPVDEPDEEVDVSTDLFVSLPVGEPDEEADVSTDQFVPSPVDEPDKEADEDIYLFRHFIKNVLWLIFPVVKVSQNHITKSIIDSLESNPCSLRSCLSIAAIHLKYMEGCKGLTEADIMRHRHAATLEHCKAMESDHRLVLEAALSTIFIQCSDDFLSDIPWRHHLEAGALLVKELKLPLQHPLMSLTAWVDILGATMVARSPVFAHVYREMRETGLALGLFQLMGCEDRIMCVISEIACLEELKASGAIDHVQLCNRVIALSVILNESELAFESNYPYSLDGALVLNLLLGNISVIFRIATRIYLCSVIDSKDETAIGGLINDFTAAMHYIPLGFERSLVWPLLIAGSMSIPQSTFRTVFTSRIADASEAGFGRFGHMVSLVQEVWHQSKQSDSGSNAHWRDVMKAKGWDFILV